MAEGMAVQETTQHGAASGGGPRRAEVVLDEDEYTLRIERIIERDFFPDVPQMQNRLEWLQAVNSGDPTALRNAQMNIAARRAGVPTPLGATPAEFATPAAAAAGTPYGATPVGLPRPATGLRTPLGGGVGDSEGNGGATAAAAEDKAPDMSLNAFLNKHTSEDNASFAEILEEGNKKRRQKNAWLYQSAAGGALPLLEEGSAGEQEQQKAVSDGHGMGELTEVSRIGWKYNPKNHLYYSKDAVALSKKEVALSVAGPAKRILHNNTRLPSASKSSTGLFSPDSQPGTPQADVGTPAGTTGYGVLATPSMTPGADGMSPLMTWGDIESTPMRIEAEDMPEGPTFRLPEEKPRDLLGRKLAGAAPSNTKSRPGLTRFASPMSLLRRGSGTPGSGAKRSGTPLSPAAKRLLLSQMQNGTPRGKGSGAADLGLRASYKRPTSSTTAKTPNGATPKPLHSRRPPTHTRTPVRLSSSAEKAPPASADKPSSNPPQANLTDGLLNI